MPSTAVTQYGVRLETQITDQSGKEVTSFRLANTGVASLAASGILKHVIGVQWLWARRPGNVRITADVIQNSGVASHANGSPWRPVFLNVLRGRPRSVSEPLTLHGPTGQVIIDCGAVEVEDIWKKGRWLPDRQAVQLILDVQP